jgi:hypothetical protein
VKPSLEFFFVLALVGGIQAAAYAQQARPEIRFPEEGQMEEGTVSHGPAASPWSDPPLVYPSSPRVDTGGAGRDSIADQLNRAELNRLLGRGPRGEFR